MSSTTERIPFIDLHAQQARIRGSLDERMAAVLAHGRYINGPEVKELEARLADFVGSPHAIACNSGSDALLVALMAYGVGPGDAVFVPSFTFPATPESVVLLGATPVFVDIDPTSYNICLGSLERSMAALAREHPDLKPRGVMAVDLYGQPAPYRAIRQLLEGTDLFVVQDAAQSFGATAEGRRCPAHGDIGCTSFFPAKPLGCYGDGGMIFTEDEELAAACRSICSHGKGDDKYDIVREGLNSRLDSLQAAILLAKMEIFEEELALRQATANAYHQALADIPSLARPELPEGVQSAWAQYTLRAADAESRAAARAALDAAGVPTMVYYPLPLHQQTGYRETGLVLEPLEASCAASQQVFSVPFHPYLPVDVPATVAATLAAVSATP